MILICISIIPPNTHGVFHELSFFQMMRREHGRRTKRREAKLRDAEGIQDSYPDEQYATTPSAVARAVTKTRFFSGKHRCCFASARTSSRGGVTWVFHI